MSEITVQPPTASPWRAKGVGMVRPFLGSGRCCGRLDELSTVAHDALMRYKGFVIIWVESPISAHEWVLNINPADRAGLTKLSRTKVIKGATLEEAKDEARQFIDDLLA